MNTVKSKMFKSITRVILFMTIAVGLIFPGGGRTVQAADPWNNAADYYNTYGDKCVFSVVSNEPRIYFGSAGTKAVSATRYRTIGWKVSLYLNGNYQESVYCKLGGSYLKKCATNTSNGTEYNLYYVNFNDLRSRFSNQSAINGGAGTIVFDAVMSIVPANSNTPNGTIDDNGYRTGEVYDTFDGISKARGWAHPGDLAHYYNKTPEGLYRTVSVSAGSGISSVSGGGTYVYGARATISATPSAGYDFSHWVDKNGTTLSKGSSFSVKVTDNLSYSAYGKPQTHTVSYDANGGSGAPANQTKTYGQILTLDTKKPTKTGYIFNYWDGSDGHTYAPGASFGTDADTKLTAHWTAITYYVAYDKNKSNAASNNVTGIMPISTHSYNNEIKSAGYTSNLSKNEFNIKGWSFRYWDSQANDKGTDYANQSFIKNLTSTNNTTVTMYAQWKPNVYRLLLDDQYATTSGTAYIYEKYDYGWYSNTKYAKDFAGNYLDGDGNITKVVVPKMIGMKFNGYYTKKDGQGTQYIDANGNIVASNHEFDTNEKTVYAYWTPNIYDITLDNQGANSGSTGTTHIYEKYTVGFFSKADASKAFANNKINLPKKDNYIFDGYWTKQNDYKSSNGEEIINADGTINDVNTKFTENATIYAKWIPKDYKINLDNQGADVDKGSSAFYEKYNEYNYTSTADYDVNTGIATLKYNYTGNVQYFIAPADGEYELTVAGAQGGDHPATTTENATASGGYGGKTTGKIKLKKGDILSIYVGNKPTGYNGSFNGSDTGWTGWAANNTYVGGSNVAGGGATDIRKNGSALSDRVIVAGGGGGATFYAGKAVNGGKGGGAEAGTVQYITAIDPYYGKIFTTVNSGATQTGHFKFIKYEQFSSNSGGGVLSNPNSGTHKGFRYYIEGNAQNKGLYGGGGGYWGGAYMYGDCVMSGGLGGSSYIGGVTNGKMEAGTNPANGWAKITYNAKELGQSNVIEKYFNYTGNAQSFTAPFDGDYLLEVAGAQGGVENSADSNAKGGLSSGKIHLSKNQTIYIQVGGMGGYDKTSGGYNGGGSAGNSGVSGGGATSITTTNRGVLKNYVNNKNEVLIVAGGGGGSTHGPSTNSKSSGGSGGGQNGSSAGNFNSNAQWAYKTLATGGTQSSGGKAGVVHHSSSNLTLTGEDGSFGQGGNGTTSSAYNGSNPSADYGAGGGGGWYGGGSTCVHGGAGGGSGYINTSKVTGGSTSNGGNAGNGWAKITYVDTSISDSSACSIRVPQKTGYKFDGYWTTKDESGDLIVDNAGIVTTKPNYFHEGTNANVNSNNETTIYAHWTKNAYHFIYKGNGGKTSDGKDTIVDNVSYNTTYHVRSTSNIFYWTGHKLTGWKEQNPDGSWGKEWPADTDVTYLIDHSTTVYAQWEAKDVNYVVNYYKENLDGDYTYIKKETKAAKADSVITVTPNTGKYFFDTTGFTLNKEKSCTGSNQLPEEIDSNGYVKVKILGDGTTSVNYYYSRNSYKLTLKIADSDEGFEKLTGAGNTRTDNSWSQDKKYGESVTIGAELKDKFSFVDWEYEDETLVSENPTYSFNMPSNDVTLYAYSNSKPNNPDPPVNYYTVTVKHYFQNGDSSYKEDTSKTITETVEENTIYTPKITMIPEGYSYSKMVDASTNENVANGFIVTKNTIVNVYYDRLQYKIVTERYVDGVLYDTFSENAYYNETYSVKELDLEKCDLTGYELDKIAVPDLGNVKTFTVTKSILNDNPIKIYYVPRSFKITFNANGGNITDNNGSAISSTQKTVRYNHTDNNDVSSLNPRRTGYTFLGWYSKITDEDGIEGEIQVYNAKGNCSNNGIHWKDSKWIMKSDITVYAHWQANNYTLTLDANGGYLDGGELEDGGKNTIATCSPIYDDTMFNDVAYLNPQRTGYTFLGWYTGKTDGMQIYDAKGKCTNDGTFWKDGKWHLTKDATVYAHWKANEYKIFYDGNKPATASSSVTGKTDPTQHTYDSYGKLAENGFKLTGWSFVNWNTKADGSGTSYSAGQSVKNLSTGADITLYAQWKANTYTIHFDKNKPSNASHEVTGEMKDVTFTYDVKKNLPDNSYKLVGWTFKGWNTKADKSGTHYDNKASINNMTTKDNETITLYAEWTANKYTVTYKDKMPDGANPDNKIEGSMPKTSFVYDDPAKPLEKNKFTLDGWTFDGWDGPDGTYKDGEKVKNLTDKDGGNVELTTRWKDDTPPDPKETYLQVTNKDGSVAFSDKAYASDKSKDPLTTYRTNVQVANFAKWSTSWINNPVWINLYSHDIGSGIGTLTVYQGMTNGAKWYERSSFDNKYALVNTINPDDIKYKSYATNGSQAFYGIAKDVSGNPTETRRITVKIDTKAPDAVTENGSKGFTVKTGTLNAPLISNYDSKLNCNTSQSLKRDSDGNVIGVNPDGMRTEIAAKITDKNGTSTDVSGVKYVWVSVTDTEHKVGSKSYNCRLVAGDKYEGTYVAVDSTGNMPNLYEEFPSCAKLKVQMYAVDEAGNVNEINSKNNGDEIVTNISLWSQVERSDKTSPDNTWIIPAGTTNPKGPTFLLNQSGIVHIVTYGYVEAVDISFPSTLQTAALIDVSRGQSEKKLGTVANVLGAYIDGRISLSGDCTRITDYQFTVPLYLDDTSLNFIKQNAEGSYTHALVDTIEIPYKGHDSSGNLIEPYSKTAGDRRSTASFYCAKDYIASVTEKLHTHLVN